MSIRVYPLLDAHGLTRTCTQEMTLTNLLVASTWMTAGALHTNPACAQGTALANTIPAATSATSTTQQTPGDIIQSAARRTLSELQSKLTTYGSALVELTPRSVEGVADRR